MKRKTKEQRLSNVVAKKLSEQYGTAWLLWDNDGDWGVTFNNPKPSTQIRCPNCKMKHASGWDVGSLAYGDGGFNKLAKLLGAEKGDANRITIVLEHD